MVALIITGLNVNTVALIMMGGPVIKTSKIGDLNKVGNANYFNEKDGKYYADAKYKIEANDNTSYLLSLFNSGASVKIPAGSFLCKAKIILKGKKLSVSGIKGRTKIIFDSKNFNGSSSYIGSLIINASYADQYKADTAQSIDISNIAFVYKRYSISSPNTMMLFMNIKSANIKNCSFIADYENGNSVTNLDLFNGCKNVKVSDCYFSNKTKALSGGCIWVRNLTTKTKAIIGNTTENININKCSFYKDSKDEVIAVYSVMGHVKNVVISNCNIKDYSDKQEVVLSVYSSEDKNYGIVDKVTIRNNSIYSQKINAFVIMIGVGDRAKPTSDVMIEKNRIVTDSQNNSKKTIIYNSERNKSSNILVNNNIIFAKPCPYYTAIANASSVDGNKINGEIGTGIYGGIVKNNVISDSENGIVSAEAVFNNVISNAKYGIRLYEDKGDCSISDNIIELDKDTGYCGIQIISKYNISCSKNKIKTYSEKQYGIFAKGSNITLSDNQVLGKGIISINK